MKVKVVTAFNDRQNGYVTRPVNLKWQTFLPFPQTAKLMQKAHRGG